MRSRLIILVAALTQWTAAQPFHWPPLDAAARAAQSRPNFAGIWETPTGVVFAVAQDDKTLTLRIGPGAGLAAVTVVHDLSGNESRNVTGSTVTLSKTTWDADRLIITEMTTLAGDAKRGRVSVWSLKSVGELTIETTFAEDPGHPTRTTLRKK